MRDKGWWYNTKGTKNNQRKFELDLNIIASVAYKSEEQKSVIKNAKHRKKLLDDLTTILQLHLGININRFMEKDSKMLTPKQMVQRLSIALAQVKAGNTSENLTKRNWSNDIFFVSSKKITKKVYNNIMNSIKV